MEVVAETVGAYRVEVAEARVDLTAVCDGRALIAELVIQEFEEL
jgi:hypothetical protein